MSNWLFELDILDEVARAIGSLASKYADHSSALSEWARSAQASGGSSDVANRIRYASSILDGHRDSLQRESADLKNRLVIARSTADDWNGDQAGLRVALAAAMAATAGAIAAKQVTGAGAGGRTAGQRDTAIVNAIFDAAGRKMDCVAYINHVMSGAGLNSHGQIYDWHNWQHAGYTVVDGWGSSAAPGMDLPGSTAIPQRGSFIELGKQTSDGNDTSGHHAAYYLGYKNGAVYVAESNWAGQAASVTAYNEKDGVVVATAVSKASIQNMRWDSDDANAAKQLALHYKDFNTAFFYQPTNASDAPVSPAK